MFPSSLLAGKWDGECIAKFKNISHSDGPCTLNPTFELEIKINVKDGNYMGQMKSDCGEHAKIISGSISKSGSINFTKEFQVVDVEDNLLRGGTDGAATRFTLFTIQLNGKLNGKITLSNRYKNFSVYSESFKLKKSLDLPTTQPDLLNLQPNQIH